MPQTPYFLLGVIDGTFAKAFIGDVETNSAVLAKLRDNSRRNGVSQGLFLRTPPFSDVCTILSSVERIDALQEIMS